MNGSKGSDHGQQEPPGSSADTHQSATSTDGATLRLHEADAQTPPAVENGRLRPGTLLAGRYRVVRLLGRGGMGEVYQAEDLRLGQSVALKFLNGDQESPRHLRSLLREVRAARSIVHPNVCAAYDIAQVAGRHFLSMEHIEGETLARMLRRVGPPRLAKALALGQQICLGLAAAHDKGILHRDLKPGNLMIDHQGRARLTDFGLATALHAKSSPMRPVGTPAYMAPELWQQQPATVASDLYGLGAVLYELCTGEPPHRAGSAPEYALLHRERDPTPPGGLVSDMPRRVERVILRCLHKDPGQRPSSAVEVAANLVTTSTRVGSGTGTTSHLKEWQPAPGSELPHRPNWQLDRHLGQGGAGQAWLARHRKTGEVRVFKFSVNEHGREALEREITLFRLLRETLGERSDIGRVLDWNLLEPPYFLEAEYRSDGSLCDYARRQGGLVSVPLTVRLEIVAQVATALAAAHSVGVLHQDVKPANVLMGSEPDGSPRAQLSDFGLGQLTQRELLAEMGITNHGVDTLLEKPNGTGPHLYLAPERQEGKAATVQADIYSLGVLLYQMVVGDLSRALAPGWEREVEDELLVEDIAATVDGEPSRRLGDAGQLAQSLRRLPQRHLRRERTQQQERAQERLRRARRRLHLGSAAALVLIALGTLLSVQARRAGREATHKRQVADYLLRLFEQPGTPASFASRLSVRQFVDRGADRVATELHDQPEVQAAVHQRLGLAYKSLGLDQPAIAQLQRSLDLRLDLGRGQDVEAAQNLLYLTELHRRQGRTGKAEQLARQALALWQQHRGTESLGNSLAQRYLADVLYAQGNYAAAEELYLEALARHRRLADGPSYELAELQRNLAAALAAQKRWPEAERRLLAALALHHQLFGEEHVEVVLDLSNLGLLYQGQGQYDRAVASFREVLAMNLRLLGEEHPQIISNLCYLAGALQSSGDLQQAEQLFRQALQLHQEVLVEKDLLRAFILERLGRLGQHNKDTAGALRYLKEARQILLQQSEPNARRMAGLDARIRQLQGNSPRS